MAKILLVEDDVPFRSMLQIALAQFGYVVREAGDGQEATQSLREESADLVLTDILMPGKEGLELIGELRMQCPSMKIVAMSGGGRVNPAEYLKIAQRLGVDGVLAKPFSSEELRSVLAKLLGPLPASQLPTGRTRPPFRTTA